MPGRTLPTSGGYRYGFNGKEEDDEVKGNGNQQDYGMRIYDPRVGKFLSVDPLTNDYPWYSPYQFAGNKPIWAIDLDGAEEYYSNQGVYLGHGKDKQNNQLRLATRFEQLKDKNGNLIKDRFVIFESKEIKIIYPGENLKRLYNDAKNAGGSNGKERGGFLVLNVNNATLSFVRFKQETQNSENRTYEDPTTTFKGVTLLNNTSDYIIVLANIHTHQQENNYIGKTGIPLGSSKPVKITDDLIFNEQYSTPTSDGNKVKGLTYNIFAIGNNVDFFNKEGREKSINNLTTKNQLFNNNFNILRYALEKHGGKK